jgi:zinc and cadmium transporter
MPQGHDLSSMLWASMAVAAAALSARLVVWLPPQRLRVWLPWLQAIAAGLLLGDALLHMLPEAMAHGLGPDQAGTRLALGIFCLLCVECVMRAMRTPAATAVFARMDLVGDALHHLVDGVVIGASFAIDRALGLVVALAILAHELPREIGNAGVLVAGGYAPRRAFLLSIATTVAIPLGALGIALVGHSPLFLGTSLALAAGTTIYLACGDVLPGLWSSTSRGYSFTPALGVASGMAFMWLAAMLDHGH